MKKTAMITLLMILVSTVAGAGGAINQFGYLKDKGRNRMTAAYYYPEGSTIPASDITLAKTMFRANHVLYDVPGWSKWDYAFMRSFNGSTRFVNCMLEPTDELCRQK